MECVGHRGGYGTAPVSVPAVFGLDWQRALTSLRGQCILSVEEILGGWRWTEETRIPHLEDSGLMCG